MHDKSHVCTHTHTRTQPAPLHSFAGETLYLVPRRREGREDAFREWVETLGTPSAVASLRQWPSSTGTAQTELLHAVERVAARLRTDPLRRLLTAYAEPRWPAVALDRYRLHERGVALPVARAHAATADVLAVSNPGDRPVLVALVPPTVPRVAVLATPSAFRLEPKASRSVRLTFIAKGSGDNNKVETEEEEAQLPADTYFLEVFCCTVTQGKDRKTLAPTRVDGYPAVVPLCFEYTAGDQGSTLPVYASAGALGQAVCAGGSAAVAGLGSVALVTVGDTAYCRKGWCLEGGDVAGAAEAAEAEAQRLAGLEWPGLLLPAFVVLPTDAAHGGLYYPYAALTEAAREGTLYALLASENARDGPRLESTALRVKMGLDVAEALACAHACGLAHGAVVPDNVLVGTCALGRGALDATARPHARLLGSWLGACSMRAAQARYFTAPELSDAQGTAQGTFEGDVYALGMLLYSLFARALPFADAGAEYARPDVLEPRIRAGMRPDLAAPALAALPPATRALLAACWHADPAQRPPVAHVVQQLHLTLALLAAPAPLVLDTLPPAASLPNAFSVPQKQERVCVHAPVQGKQHQQSRVQRTPSIPPPPLPPPSPSEPEKDMGDDIPPPPPPAQVQVPEQQQQPLEQQRLSSETVVIRVERDGRVFRMRVAREMARLEHVTELACRLFHVAPADVRLMDARTDTALDEGALEALVREYNSAAASEEEDIETALWDARGMVCVELRVRSAVEGRDEVTVPFGLFPPGHTLRDVLRALGTRQTQLARVCGVQGLALVDRRGGRVRADDDTRTCPATRAATSPSTPSLPRSSSPSALSRSSRPRARSTSTSTSAPPPASSSPTLSTPGVSVQIVVPSSWKRIQKIEQQQQKQKQQPRRKST